MHDSTKIFTLEKFRLYGTTPMDTEDFQIFATQIEKRSPLRHLPPFHMPRAASDVEDHVFCFALYGVARIWKSSV